MDPAAIGALLAGIGGFVTAWTAMRRAKREGATDCHEQLAVAREESERYAAELHALRVAHPELIDDDGVIAFSTVIGIVAALLFVLAGILALHAFGGDVGPPGPKGDPGIPGASGPPGVPGANGERGTTATTTVVVPGTGTSPGVTGAAGATGATGGAGVGTQGTQGPPGPPGSTVTGPQGAPGPVGPSGPPGPAGAQGEVGRAGMECPLGYQAEHITINGKGGQVDLFACVKQ